MASNCLTSKNKASKIAFKGCQNWQPFFYANNIIIVILAIQLEFKFFINQNITQL